MDLNQYMFYVTAHRHVATPIQFRIVAIIPFFIHTTMCTGDFAMLNFYWLNKKKKIYTWDDADQKVAYFYEEL